jgi:hypothetical protein
MFKASLPFLSLIFSLFIHADAWQDFPVQIVCKEHAEDLEPILKLALRPSTNESKFYYKSPQMPQAITIIAGDVGGPSSYSSVQIESSRGDNMSSNQILRLSGHESHVTRVLTFKDFQLELMKMLDGSFVAKQLSYAVGKDTSPDSQIIGNIQFTNLRCSVVGI